MYLFDPKNVKTDTILDYDAKSKIRPRGSLINLISIQALYIGR